MNQKVKQYKQRVKTLSIAEIKSKKVVFTSFKQK